MLDTLRMRPGDAIAGRYRVLRRLDTGGASGLWLADDENLSCTAAVRLVPGDAAALTRLRELRTRLEELARLGASALAVPYDVDAAADGVVLLATDYLPAGTLDEHPAASLQTLLRWAREILTALAVAGARGLTHGCLTPRCVQLETAADGRLHARLAGVGEAAAIAGEDPGEPSDVVHRRDRVCVAAMVLELMTGRRFVDWAAVADRGVVARVSPRPSLAPRAELEATPALLATLDQAMRDADDGGCAELADALAPFLLDGNAVAGELRAPVEVLTGRLEDVDELLAACDSVAGLTSADAVLRAVPRQACRLLDVVGAEVVERGPGGRMIVTARVGAPLDLRDPQLAQEVSAVFAGQPARLLKAPDTPATVAETIYGHAIVPMRWGGKVNALVLRTPRETPPTPRALARLTVFGTLAGAALERAQARQSLIDETACRAATLELVTDAVLVIARGGIVRAASAGAADILDVHREAVVGRSLRDLPGFSELMRALSWSHAIDREVVPIPSGHALIRARPFPDGMVVRLEKLAQAPRRRSQHHAKRWRGFDDIIGSDPGVVAAIRRGRHAATHDKPVLITGEPGTGSALLAEAIHRASARSDGPFTVIPVGSILRERLEGALLGGADEADQAPGQIELTDGGTLVLHRVEHLPDHLQAVVLEVIETGTLARAGGGAKAPVDVRVIATSEVDLAAAARDGTFSRALHRALSATPLALPALRARSGDVPLLVRHYAEHYSAELGRSPITVDDAVLGQLMRYHWPGNVHELAKLVEAWMSLLPPDQSLVERAPAHIRKALESAGS